MKTDGVTLLDSSKVESSSSEFIGESFPDSPSEGATWTLVTDEGVVLGNYIFSLGAWLPIANPTLAYSDISFSTEGVIPSDTTLARYAVGKPCYIPRNFEFSVGILLTAGSSDSEYVVNNIRDGVTTKLADITFAMDSRRGVITSTLTADFLMLVGDVLSFESKTVDAEGSDICVTLSTYLA